MVYTRNWQAGIINRRLNARIPVYTQLFGHISFFRTCYQYVSACKDTCVYAGLWSNFPLEKMLAIIRRLNARIPVYMQVFGHISC